jgi:hypothetical protein
MAAKKNYHKPAEDPRTIGGGLKAAGRERREKLSAIINTTPRNIRNDLLPSLELQTIAIADIKMPKHMVRKLDEGHIKEVAHGIQAMGGASRVERRRRRGTPWGTEAGPGTAGLSPVSRGLASDPRAKPRQRLPGPDP